MLSSALVTGTVMFGWIKRFEGQSRALIVVAAIAIVIIGGLVSATVLTLIVLPVLYLLFNRDKEGPVNAG